MVRKSPFSLRTSRNHNAFDLLQNIARAILFLMISRHSISGPCWFVSSTQGGWWDSGRAYLFIPRCRRGWNWYSRTHCSRDFKVDRQVSLNAHVHVSDSQAILE
ncbi:hypothetical protein BS78_10G032700 [Paspalum vaginatum]|nr:hypothetical protein BS78_10G032700 [Paspalum vaginatum]